MASAGERTLDDVLARIERRERTARVRAVLYSLVPIAMAVVLLGYSAFRVQTATNQVQLLRGQAADLQRQVIELENQIAPLRAQLRETENLLKDTEKRLREATEFSRYIHPIDFVDVKVLFSRYPRQARVLEQILLWRERKVRWHLGGQSPAEGFDSPGFAAFILRELNLPGGEIRPGESLLSTSRRLFERLAPVSQPNVGDLAFYPAGYVLFYFVDRGDPFVIGMTPFGIVPLKPNFALVVGYRRAGR